MGEPVNVVRMTISVPREVKARMDAVEVPVNWSAVATDAFRRKVVEIRTGKSKAMTREKVIERLKAAGEADLQGFEAGRRFGRKWVEEKALPRHLRNLAKDPDQGFQVRIDPQDEEQNPWPLYAALARAITGHSGDYQDFWVETIGPDGYRLANIEDFARGFVAGALEVWEEVKDDFSPP